MAASLSKSPILSVVMTVYNGDKYLRESMDSVLAQTFSDFELIIINDGSTDNTAKILSSYKDSRIKVINQPNKGLVASLNRGIKAASGKYIARHDADDSSEPSRFAKQVKILDDHPNVVIVGTSMRVMDSQSKILHEHLVLIGDSELRQELLVRSPFAHGSVMFKKDVAIKAGLYNQKYWPAEDYELWLRMCDYGELANIDEPLYTYREHEGGISFANQKLQIQQLKDVQALAWQIKDQLIQKRIRLAPYKRLPKGQLRIERILANTVYISRRSSRAHNFRFAIKNTRLIATSPQTYRKLAGKVRRKKNR